MSLLETYQSRKNLLASNLEEQGISADGNEGLTSLINKVLDIQGSALQIQTQITQSSSNPFDLESNFFVGDSVQIKGTLKGTMLDNINIGGLGNATISLICADRGSLTEEVIGSATTDNTGAFTINATFNKACPSGANIIASFEGTNYFLPTVSIYAKGIYVNKVAILMPTVEDYWTLTPSTYEASMGQQYANLTMNLMINEQLYDTATVNSSGNVVFDITTLTGHNEAYISFEGNDAYEASQSYIFNLDVGVDIYLNPKLSITSTKDTLSYVHSEPATITTQLIDGATLQPLNIANQSIVLNDSSQNLKEITMQNEILDYAVSSDGYILEFEINGQFSLDGMDRISGIEMNILENNTTNFHTYKIINDSINTTIYCDGVIEDSLDDVEMKNLYFHHTNTYVKSFSIKNIYKTNDTGAVSYVYMPQGAGDVVISANVYDTSIETHVTIEDCIYYNTIEKTHTTKGGSTIYDSNMHVALPTNCEISYDLWSDNTNDSSEFRYFILPKAQTSTGTTQPTYALHCDALNNKVRFGKRDNNTTYNNSNTIPATNSNYHRIKYIRTNTSVEMYVDDNLVNTETINWLDNYSDYCMQMMRWNQSGTSKLKNVKIKLL